VSHLLFSADFVLCSLVQLSHRAYGLRLLACYPWTEREPYCLCKHFVATFQPSRHLRHHWNVVTAIFLIRAINFLDIELPTLYFVLIHLIFLDRTVLYHEIPTGDLTSDSFETSVCAGLERFGNLSRFRLETETVHHCFFFVAEWHPSS
jgi:hypothetical protein